jgi:phage terminase large subunit-like protein
VTNPNLNASVSQDFLERGLAQAENDGEASVRGFLAKHLNVEIGLALLSNRWVGADLWERNARNGVTLEHILKTCDVATVGIDGGGLDDLLGLVVCGRVAQTREWLVWAHAWVHRSALELRKSIASKLLDFAAAGDLTIVDDLGTDVMDAAAVVARCEEAGLLPEKNAVGVDPYGIGAILDALEAAGIPKEKIMGVPQGWKLGAWIKTTERRLAEGQLVHGGRGMMAWCVGNARVEPRGNAILITKQASGTGKIDPLMALFDAVSLMSLNPDGGGSFWERSA